MPDSANIIPLLRLAHLVLVNAAILWAGWQFAGRWTVSRLQRAADALLILLAVQYVAILAPGLLGVLSAASASAVAIAIAGALWWYSRGVRTVARPRLSLLDSMIAWGVAMCLGGYLLAYFNSTLGLTVTATDSLAYHFPAAVDWLQSGSSPLHETWFFNPANTYSPLAGSAFIAWLIAPMGNDAIARLVEVEGMLFIFVLVARLSRLIGASVAVASLMALAAVFCRLTFAELLTGKDDLFFAGFFLAAVVALGRDSAGERIAPWRAGVALGLMLATKYTALLALPVLLLMIDAPARAGWRARHYGILIGVALVLAAPWYLRNAILTGNPVFPMDVRLGAVTVFNGKLVAERSLALRSFRGLWNAVTNSYFGIPPALAATLLAGWALALAFAGRRALREPLVRAVVIGPALATAIVAFVSPYGDVRFLAPAIMLLFACAAMAISQLGSMSLERMETRKAPASRGSHPDSAPSWLDPGALAATALAGALAIFCAVTANISGVYFANLLVALIAFLIGLLAGALAWMWQDLAPRRFAWAALVVLVLLASYAIAAWPDIVEEYVAESPAMRESQYPEYAAAWEFVRKKIPSGSRIAYANTPLVYPLYGPKLANRVIYVPIRPEVKRLADLPHFAAPVPGEKINDAATELANSGGDENAWLKRLAAEKVEYVFVLKRQPHGQVAPELAYIRDHPGRFEVVFGTLDDGTTKARSREEQRADVVIVRVLKPSG